MDNSRKAALAVFGLIGFAMATAAAVWLAGFLFFAFSKTNPFGHTDFSTWLTYWHHYQGDPAVAKQLKVAAMVAALVAYGVPFIAFFAARGQKATLHGAARFANQAEIQEAGLFNSKDDGIIIGKFKGRYLVFSGMQFVLLAAPTRSGKGVGNVIPNLLNWAQSLVVLDVKLENFLITSKFRSKHGQEVYLFNPFSIAEEDGEGNPLYGKSHRYNPLGYISDDRRLRVTDILAIGYSLYPGDGKDSFFDDAARNLFLGLTLYLCETPNLPRTMGELLRQSSGKGQPIKKYLTERITERNFRSIETRNDSGEVETTLVPIEDWDGTGLAPLSGECVDALNRFTSTSDNTLSSIMASFNVPLTLWASPIVDAATSANDFDLRDVRKKRMTIYLGVPANKLKEGKLLFNMFYTQLVNLNTNRVLHSTPSLKYTCLMLCDEFTAPGRIGAIDTANSFMAGYGLRLLTIVQSPGQLEADAPHGYGREKARTLMTNHACQIFYTPREQRDANEYSEALGYYTFKSMGTSRQLGGKSAGGRSESQSDQKRALMLPQELKEMSQKEQIISLENTKPIRCEKIQYFADNVFMDRLKSVSPSLAKLGKKLPSKSELEAAWGSGECASDVPDLNLDLHEAVVQGRSRELTVADVARGIDLATLNVDLSSVPVPTGSGIDPDQVESFVDGFFAALDGQNTYDEEGAMNLVIDATDAETGEVSEPQGAEDIQPSIDDTQSPEPSEATQLASEIGHDQFELDSADVSAEELAALLEDEPEYLDDSIDEEALLAAIDEVDPQPEVSGVPQAGMPALDLSVLEKPLPSN